MPETTVPFARPWWRFWPKDVPRSLDYPEVPLFELLSLTAARYPDAIAFSCGNQKLTYRRLDRASAVLSAHLHKRGVRQGDRIILALPNGLEFVISYYGILKAGATVCPSNPMYKAEELGYQVKDASAAGIITDGTGYEKVRHFRAQTAFKSIILAGGALEDADSLADILRKRSSALGGPAVALRPGEDIAAIVYTGGTTGFPKGAMLTHRNLVANAMQNAAWFNWTHDDVIMGVLPFYHSWGGSTCINSPIYAGARVVVLPRFDAEELLSAIQREKATVLYGATSMFISLLASPLLPQYDLSSLRYVKAGAMPVPPEVKERWEQATGVTMVTGYGLSEASPEVCNSPPKRVKPGAIGFPMMDTDGRVVDQETGTNDLPTGEVGELTIRGPQVMKGYLNRPDDNRETLREGWLYTGDLGFVDDEGYFHVVDRKKEIIKYKGYTIAPAEVEAALYEHPAVRECAVIGKPDELAGEVPKACVVLKAGCSATAEELIRFCEGKVAAYKRVREVEFVSEIPKTAVGKVLRRVLRDRERARQATP